MGRARIRTASWNAEYRAPAGTVSVHYRDDPSAEDGVAVENEVVRRGVIRKRLAKLLDDPGCQGMLGDIEMKNSSASVFDSEPDIEDAEGGRGYGEEVHGRD